MLTNSRPMKIELLGRLVSDWEETKKGDYCLNFIAINYSGVTYFFKLIAGEDNAQYQKGQKVSINGNIMDIHCYNNISRVTVFVEVIEIA